MSRGPGSVQRIILDSLAATDPDYGVQIVDDECTDSEASSRRSAARRLAELELIRLERRRIERRRRLTAWRP